MEKSLWQKYESSEEYSKVDKDMDTDILIIGAGLTGVTTAYNLIGDKNKVIVIDRGKCGDGVTARSTGKITYLQDLMYQKINEAYGFDAAKLYYESQKEATRIIKKNIKDNDIECDFQKSDAITFTKDEKELQKFEEEKIILEKMGVNYSTVSKYINAGEVESLITVKNTYVFNPIKYVNALLKIIKTSDNISVYENSIATGVRKENNQFVVNVNDYEIKAKKIIFSCNYPFFIIPGLVPFKTYVEKSYVTATKVDKTYDVSGITSNYPTKSFRFHDDGTDKYLLYLSNSSKICNALNYGKNYEECIDKAKEITGKNPAYKWTNMDLMTNDSLPLIGRISDDEPNAFIATGYNTWGMTNSAIAGKIICDLLKGKSNKYTSVFNPTRNMTLKKAFNFMVNTLGGNIKAYSLNFLRKNPSWYKSQAFVTRMNGKRVGVYIDEEGKEHIVSNICPHFKCFLTFNEVDKTWDCPCHSSRFDIDGNSIKGPSKYDIKIDETKS